MYRKIILAVLLVSLLAGVSVASYISLNTTVSSKVDDNKLQIMITSINKGDESAYSVQAEINVAGQKIMAKKLQELGVDKTYKIFEEIKLDLASAGKYPLIVTMHYADANQYPFSALNAQTFIYRAEEIPAQVFGRMRSASFWKEGKVKLTLKNMGAEDISAVTNLVVPRELTVAENNQKMEVCGKSEKSASFKIENFSALHGSTYQVFAVSEYEKDGVHHTNITPGTIKIVESKEIFGISYNVIIALLALLILFFIAAQFIKKK